jgi:hypothetical protein
VLTRAAALTVGILLLQFPASAFAQAHARRNDAVPPQLLVLIRQDTTWEPRLDRFRDSLATMLFAERVDLNHDGVPELVVHGQGRICGPYWCPYWIYRRTSAGYERLLDAGNVQRLEPQATASHGYRDVTAWRHGSAWDGDVALYKFDGRQYRSAKCTHYSYTYLDARDVRHELKRPRITPEPC